MAADAPFGLSFGDPRRYMGQSPLAELGKAGKTFGIAYGLEKSGAVNFLNNIGYKSFDKVIGRGQWISNFYYKNFE